MRYAINVRAPHKALPPKTSRFASADIHLPFELLLNAALLLTEQKEAALIWNLRRPCAHLLIVLPALSCNLFWCKKEMSSPNLMLSLISIPLQILIQVTSLSKASLAIKWVTVRTE